MQHPGYRHIARAYLGWGSALLLVGLLLSAGYFAVWGNTDGAFQVRDVTVYQYGDTPTALVRGTLSPCRDAQPPDVVQRGTTFTITIATRPAAIAIVNIDQHYYHVPYRLCRLVAWVVGSQHATPSIALPKHLPPGTYVVVAGTAQDTLQVR